MSAGAAVPAPGPDALGHVRAIAPYVPGKPVSELAREAGLDPSVIVKLASNENPLGMPAGARAAAAAALAEGARYPDGSGHALRAALAERLGVDPSWIVLGNGSNEILEMAASAMLAGGRSCVFSEHAFAVYPIATQARGARAIVVPARDFGHDLPAMAAAIAPDTRLVFVANPNNPTGTFAGAEAIEAFLRAVPPAVAVVLDEAYHEFLPPALRADAVAWVRRFPNLLVSRTFSKAYGLAGLRVGYGFAQPALAGLLDRVRNPFNVSNVAQAAALAALGDEAFLRRTCEVNDRGMRQLEAGLRALGLQTIPSRGNFLLVRVGDAARIDRALLACGVIVRPVAGYGLPQWLRVSVGLREENERLLVALAQVLAALPVAGE
jgi:histidinol-phosphate aminotransferase